jgi:hypothetical protein
MRAATEALPFETPKLCGVAVGSMSVDAPGLIVSCAINNGEVVACR